MAVNRVNPFPKGTAVRLSSLGLYQLDRSYVLGKAGTCDCVGVLDSYSVGVVVDDEAPVYDVAFLAAGLTVLLTGAEMEKVE